MLAPVRCPSIHRPRNVRRVGTHIPLSLVLPRACAFAFASSRDGGTIWIGDDFWHAWGWLVGVATVAWHFGLHVHTLRMIPRRLNWIVASLATAPHTRLGCPESKTGLVRKRRKASRGPCVVLETLGWGEARWEREVWCCCIVLGVESNGHVVSLAMVLYSRTAD